MRIVSAAEAAGLIRDGWTVAVNGYGGSGHPDALSEALEARFLADERPAGLTLVFAAGQGDRRYRGLNRFAHEGLARRVIGGHWGASPALGRLAIDGRIEAYSWPQGVISQLYRAIAGRKPGVMSQVGLNTFVDPRLGGGRLNDAPAEELVELHRYKGREYLFFPAFPIHCALLRGTGVGAKGNVTMEREPFTLDALAMAQAARNSGGIVIVQVQHRADADTAPAAPVAVPGFLVDYVVIAEAKDHWQTYDDVFNEAFTRRGDPPAAGFAPLPLDAAKVIARRAYFEVARRDRPVVALGAGLGEAVVAIAREEAGRAPTVVLESGVVGGLPAGGQSFGASAYRDAVFDQASQFDFLDGGGAEVALLAFGEADGEGNVNASLLDGRVLGAGGLMHMAQGAKTVVFCGTFTTGGLETVVRDGRLEIVEEGEACRFVEVVGHLTVNGAYLAGLGREVLFVTERAVFRVEAGRLTLIEIAPGVDLERDVLERSAARIAVADDFTLMAPELFGFDKLRP